MSSQVLPKNINVLILSSGGLDSTACISYYLSRDYSPLALWVDYGQDAREPELGAVRRVAEHFEIPLRTITIHGVRWSRSRTKDELIGRNALLASVGLCSFPGSHGIVAMGVHAARDYLDCSSDFQDTMDDLARIISAGRLAMDFPFGKLTKLDIGAFCKEYDVPADLTYSCLRGKQPPCGSCPACRDRQRVKELFGI